MWCHPGGLCKVPKKGFLSLTYRTGDGGLGGRTPSDRENEGPECPCLNGAVVECECCLIEAECTYSIAAPLNRALSTPVLMIGTDPMISRLSRGQVISCHLF